MGTIVEWLSAWVLKPACLYWKPASSTDCVYGFEQVSYPLLSLVALSVRSGLFWGLKELIHRRVLFWAAAGPSITKCLMNISIHCPPPFFVFTVKCQCCSHVIIRISTHLSIYSTNIFKRKPHAWHYAAFQKSRKNEDMDPVLSRFTR